MPFSTPAYELVTHLAHQGLRQQGLRYFATVIAVMVYTYLMDDGWQHPLICSVHSKEPQVLLVYELVSKTSIAGLGQHLRVSR